MMVVKIVSIHNEYVHPYRCVVYSLNAVKPDDIVEIQCAPHGNSRKSEQFMQPYVRTNTSVLTRMDTLLENDSPSIVFHHVLNESGGPMFSTSPSTEPRNVIQVLNRQSIKRRKVATSPMNPITPPKDDIEKLIAVQRDPRSLVQTVLISHDSYLAFMYTDKQLKDIEMFCCNDNDNNASVSGIDTTFKLCNMWVTDTSYRNKRLLSTRSKKNLVHVGPVMFHFTKGEETFRRFCLELISANPKIINLKKVGVDMEAAIFNGFKSMLIKLLQLYCVRHLKNRDEKAIDNCHNKSNIPDERKAEYKMEIIYDIYGKRTMDIFEKGIADAIDEDDFNAKILSLKPRWEKLCCGFYDWFLTHRKKEFVQSVIQSAREGTNVDGLYYQNDVESLHAIQKRIQCFEMGSVLDAIQTIETLITREENDEMLALYGSSNYVLSAPYKKWYAPVWHSWSSERRARHIQDFLTFVPRIEQSFLKPLSAGQKPGYQQRRRLTNVLPNIVVDRHNATTLPTMISTPSTPLTSLSSSASPLSSITLQPSSFSSQASSQMTSSLPSSLTSPVSSQTVASSQSISFRDPRMGRETVYELHLRSKLPKTVVKCRGNCGKAISSQDRMLVKSYGTCTWRDPKTQVERSKYVPLYIHFEEECLKSYDVKNYYAPGESFPFDRIKLQQETKELLTGTDIKYLADMGIN